MKIYLQFEILFKGKKRRKKRERAILKHEYIHVHNEGIRSEAKTKEEREESSQRGAERREVPGQWESVVRAAILMIDVEVNNERRKGEPNDFQPSYTSLALSFSRCDVYST